MDRVQAAILTRSRRFGLPKHIALSLYYLAERASASKAAFLLANYAGQSTKLFLVR